MEKNFKKTLFGYDIKTSDEVLKRFYIKYMEEINNLNNEIKRLEEHIKSLQKDINDTQTETSTITEIQNRITEILYKAYIDSSRKVFLAEQGSNEMIKSKLDIINIIKKKDIELQNSLEKLIGEIKDKL